jgi:hypothetical protein
MYMLAVNIPQSSSVSSWHSGIIRVPMSTGAQFVLDGLSPIQIAKRTGVLYKITEAYFSYNVGDDAFLSGLIPTNPARVHLSITSKNGELLFANPLDLGGSHPFPLNVWRRTKNENEPLFILPMGAVDGSGDGFLGCPELDILCRFHVTSINDKDFLAAFSGGCI